MRDSGKDLFKRIKSGERPLCSTPVRRLDASGVFCYSQNRNAFRVFRGQGPQIAALFNVASRLTIIGVLNS